MPRTWLWWLPRLLFIGATIIGGLTDTPWLFVITGLAVTLTVLESRPGYGSAVTNPAAVVLEDIDDGPCCPCHAPAAGELAAAPTNDPQEGS